MLYIMGFIKREWRLKIHKKSPCKNSALRYTSPHANHQVSQKALRQNVTRHSEMSFAGTLQSEVVGFRKARHRKKDGNAAKALPLVFRRPIRPQNPKVIEKKQAAD